MLTPHPYDGWIGNVLLCIGAYIYIYIIYIYSGFFFPHDFVGWDGEGYPICCCNGGWDTGLLRFLSSMRWKSCQIGFEFQKRTQPLPTTIAGGLFSLLPLQFKANFE